MQPLQHDPLEISLLLVEPDPTALSCLSATLAATFPAVRLITAADGSAGLELSKEHRPELVLSDVALPVLDGVTLAARIRRLAPATEFIMIAASGDAELLLRAIGLGLHRYVLKPIQLEQLLEAVADALARIRLDQQVKAQQEHIRKLSRAVEQSPSTIIITDADGAIEYANPKFSALTGYSPREVIGKNPRILNAGLTPPEHFLKLWNTLHSGAEWSGEFLNRKKNGDLYWEAASISPLFDDQGKITHFVAVKDDITQQKEMQERILGLNRELHQRAAQLEASNLELEAFNHSISHDLHGPISVINGYCQLIKEGFAEELSPTCLEHFQEIETSSRGMSRLIDNLLKFSRLGREELRLEQVNLGELAQAIAVELAIRWPRHQVQLTVQEGCVVQGDERLLRIALANLLSNAWKFTAPRKSARVELGRIGAAGGATFFVRDNGTGFNPHLSDHLFTPFQRLHQREGFPGNGIGLATVRRIVQRHGGKVWAEGETGKGATFYFTLHPDSAALSC